MASIRPLEHRFLHCFRTIEKIEQNLVVCWSSFYFQLVGQTDNCYLSSCSFFLQQESGILTVNKRNKSSKINLIDFCVLYLRKHYVFLLLFKTHVKSIKIKTSTSRLDILNFEFNEYCLERRHNTINNLFTNDLLGRLRRR